MNKENPIPLTNVSRTIKNQAIDNHKSGEREREFPLKNPIDGISNSKLVEEHDKESLSQCKASGLIQEPIVEISRIPGKKISKDSSAIQQPGMALKDQEAVMQITKTPSQEISKDPDALE